MIFTSSMFIRTNYFFIYFAKTGICFKCYSVQTSTLRSETLKENISQGTCNKYMKV